MSKYHQTDSFVNSCTRLISMHAYFRIQPKDQQYISVSAHESYVLLT
jgi:hypothetical protein